MTDMILAYVPESEHLTYAEAQALAMERDRQAAEQLRLSVPDGVFPYTYAEALQKRFTKSPFRTVEKPLAPSLDPRRTWGKI